MTGVMSTKSTGRAKARKGVILAFDATLYPPAVVKQTAAAFAALAEIEIARAGGLLKVTLAPRPGAPQGDILAGEFGNYALGLACEARRRKT
jgi:hypothetical protein